VCSGDINCVCPVIDAVEPGTCLPPSQSKLVPPYSKSNFYPTVGCLHLVACTRSGSGFPSNATLV
jgi:hypothetical protein